MKKTKRLTSGNYLDTRRALNGVSSHLHSKINLIIRCLQRSSILIHMAYKTWHDVHMNRVHDFTNLNIYISQVKQLACHKRRDVRPNGVFIANVTTSCIHSVHVSLMFDATTCLMVAHAETQLDSISDGILTQWKHRKHKFHEWFFRYMLGKLAYLIATTRPCAA